MQAIRLAEASRLDTKQIMQCYRMGQRFAKVRYLYKKSRIAWRGKRGYFGAPKMMGREREKGAENKSMP